MRNTKDSNAGRMSAMIKGRSNTAMNLIEKHKAFIAWYQKRLGLSDYGLLWFVFFKGVVITLIVEYFIAR